MWICLMLLAEFSLIALGFVFLIKIQKRRTQIYSLIVGTDSETIPLQNITNAIQKYLSSVIKDITTMSMNPSYPLLKNSHIDLNKQCLVLSQESLDKHRRKISKDGNKRPFAAPQCKMCGAINKNKYSRVCEYCGSSLE